MSELQQPFPIHTDLKPERVAEGIAAPWPATGEPVPAEAAKDGQAGAPPCETSLAEAEARLWAERVQARLNKMPGWSLAAGGHAVDRLRKFATPMTAADYAGFVLREAARAKQKVRIGLEGVRVAISVMAPYRGPARGAIDLKQLDFAAALV
jgi:hypothetical protein